MLYAIIPYFNFENNKYREANIYNFIEKYKLRNNLKIIVAEAFIDNQLKSLDNMVFKHLKFKTKQKLWIKENLINLAINDLPEDYEFIAWIDGDIEFENLNWIDQTLNKLQTYDVIQLFENVIHLDKDNNLLNLNYIKENVIINQYGQPGFCWAFKKSTIKKIGGLFELDIVGMGDNFMARCFNKKIPFINPVLKNKIKTSFPFIPTSINYFNQLNNFYFKCKDLNVSYIEGDIKHFWHGHFDKRLYWERWEILEKHKYDPNLHLSKNEDGLIQISLFYKNLLKDLEEYFNIREKI